MLKEMEPNGNGIPEPSEDELKQIEAELTSIEGKLLKNYIFDHSAKERVENDNVFKLYLADLPQVIKFNSLAEDTHLALCIEGGDTPQEARDALFYSVAQMAVSEALKSFASRSSELEDSVQEGNLGILKAIDKYDWRRGVRFSTYAMHWIRAKIHREANENQSSITIPERTIYEINRMEKAYWQFVQNNGKPPKPSELAEISGKSPDEIDDLVQIDMRKTLKSLDDFIDHNDGEEHGTIEDFVKDENALNRLELEDNTDSQLLAQLIQEELKGIPKNEKNVLLLRYGMSYSLDEVGQILGVTKERVRQLEGKAINRLRFPNPRKKLEQFYERESWRTRINASRKKAGLPQIKPIVDK